MPAESGYYPPAGVRGNQQLSKRNCHSLYASLLNQWSLLRIRTVVAYANTPYFDINEFYVVSALLGWRKSQNIVRANRR